MKRTCHLVVMALLGLVGLMQSARCQEQKKPPEGRVNDHASTDYRWDISLDAYRLVAAQQLFVTLRYSPNNRGAFRVTISRLNWFAKNDASKVDSGGGYSETFDDRHEMQNFSTAFIIGYELRRNLRVGQVFYGADVTADWDNNYKNTTGILPSSSFLIAVAPFCGYKYQFSKRFSISVESNLYTDCRWSKTKTTDGEVISKGQLFGFALGPINKLNFTFHF
jgi:hypothetical protein